MGNMKIVKYSAQTLNDTEKTQARTNIGAGTYSKPSGGIPKTDLASAVQTSLSKADTALQQSSLGEAAYRGVTSTASSGSNNLITSGGVYTIIGDINSILDNINGEEV